jgi:hypothetical protein
MNSCHDTLILGFYLLTRETVKSDLAFNLLVSDFVSHHVDGLKMAALVHRARSLRSTHPRHRCQSNYLGEKDAWTRPAIWDIRTQGSAQLPGISGPGFSPTTWDIRTRVQPNYLGYQNQGSAQLPGILRYRSQSNYYYIRIPEPTQPTGISA